MGHYQELSSLEMIDRLLDSMLDLLGSGNVPEEQVQWRLQNQTSSGNQPINQTCNHTGNQPGNQSDIGFWFTPIALPTIYLPQHRDRPSSGRGGERWITDCGKLEKAVESCMQSSVAALALRCGLLPETLEKAYRKRLQDTGTSFQSCEALINAALSEEGGVSPSAHPYPHLSSPDSNSLVDSEISRQIGSVAGGAGDAGLYSQEARLRSFPSTWPLECPQQPPSLAAAGFYYVGGDDFVRCFHCCVTLSEWQKEDEPWIEHARWSPHCSFLLLTKGQAFINAHKEVQESEDLEEAVDILKKTYRKRLRDTGTTFQSSEALINAALSEERGVSPSAQPYPHNYALVDSGISRQIGIVAGEAGDAGPHSQEARLCSFPPTRPLECSQQPPALAAADFYCVAADVPGCGLLPDTHMTVQESEELEEASECCMPGCVAAKAPGCGLLPETLEKAYRKRLQDTGTPFQSSEAPSEEGRVSPSAQPYPHSPDSKIPKNYGMVASNRQQNVGLYSYDSWVGSFPPTWPPEQSQQPPALASAGFCYAGGEDMVRCHHCCGVLYNWQKGADPWIEHARWLPHCGFLRLAKGQDFINAHMQMQEGEDLEEAVERCMRGCVAAEALRSRTQPTTLEKAFRKRLQDTGNPFHNSEALINAARSEDGAASPSAPPHLQSASANPPSLPAESALQSRGAGDTGASAGAEPEREVSMEEENKRLKQELLCKVCMDVELGVVFLPCGHLVSCVQCAPRLSSCPICRSEINDFVHAHLS